MKRMKWSLYPSSFFSSFFFLFIISSFFPTPAFLLLSLNASLPHSINASLHAPLSLVAPLCPHAFTPWPLLHYYPLPAQARRLRPSPAAQPIPNSAASCLCHKSSPHECAASATPHVGLTCHGCARRNEPWGTKPIMAAMDTLGETKYFSSWSSLISVEILGLMARN